MISVDTKRPLHGKLLPQEVRLHIRPHPKPEERNEVFLRLARGCIDNPLEEMQLSYFPGGKPFLKNSQLHFSLSHTSDKILVAFAHFAVGVDVEISTRKVSCRAVAQRYFDPLESALLETCSEAECQIAFFRMWVRKEAAVKMTGEGLALGLRKVRVDPAEDGWPVYRQKEKLFVKEIAPWPGAIGAIVARHQFSVTVHSEI